MLAQSLPSHGSRDVGDVQPVRPVGSGVLSAAMPLWLMKVTTSLRAAEDQTAWGLQVGPHLADLMIVRLLQLRPCSAWHDGSVSCTGVQQCSTGARGRRSHRVGGRHQRQCRRAWGQKRWLLSSDRVALRAVPARLHQQHKSRGLCRILRGDHARDSEARARSLAAVAQQHGVVLHVRKPSSSGRGCRELHYVRCHLLP